MSKRPATSLFLLQLTVLLVFVTLCFFFQSYFFIGELDWIRTPTKIGDTARIHHALAWHIFGAIGGILFSARFWVQWWQAERLQKSDLSPSFWWLSIIGSFISLSYFVQINDTVSILQYSAGLIPYFRNLMLLRKSQA